ncbi:MAG: esterase family protein [Chitinophagaceae bacterium]|nr:esterase family protein [Chitinophagaceae bacterium]
MRRLFISLILTTICYSVLKAAIVDTILVPSAAMKKDIKCVVIRPSHPQDENIALPVVYLLHGWSGNFSNWITRVPELKKYADDYKMMIVCPDGHYSSWYFDSPIDPSMKYETYIGIEVPEYIDAHYTTIKNRKGRAITGLSMGGHGGLFLGFRHAGTFGACGSMSGGVALYASGNKFDIIKRIGDTLQYPDNWKKYSVMSTVEKYPPDSIAIIVDCGTEDFFYPINHELHEKMLKLKIPHDYIERPGKHDWLYWANAVHYQLLFFRNYFDKGK